MDLLQKRWACLVDLVNHSLSLPLMLLSILDLLNADIKLIDRRLSLLQPHFLRIGLLNGELGHVFLDLVLLLRQSSLRILLPLSHLELFLHHIELLELLNRIDRL